MPWIFSLQQLSISLQLEIHLHPRSVQSLFSSAKIQSPSRDSVPSRALALQHYLLHTMPLIPNVNNRHHFRRYTLNQKSILQTFHITFQNPRQLHPSIDCDLRTIIAQSFKRYLFPFINIVRGPVGNTCLNSRFRW